MVPLQTPRVGARVCVWWPGPGTRLSRGMSGQCAEQKDKWLFLCAAPLKVKHQYPFPFLACCVCWNLWWRYLFGSKMWITLGEWSLTYSLITVHLFQHCPSEELLKGKCKPIMIFAQTSPTEIKSLGVAGGSGSPSSWLWAITKAGPWLIRLPVCFMNPLTNA